MQDYTQGALDFYNRNKREDLESLSGNTSSLLQTYHLRENMKTILADVNSVADCPCGDWNWMRSVKLDGIDYTGYDILPDVINSNKERFPKYNFELFDAVTEVLPKVDLIICKDFLNHLHDAVIEQVIENFKKSKSTYLLATYYIKSIINNMGDNWGWKELDPSKYGLNEPINVFMDTPKRSHGLYKIN
jgi:hypothetical protein|tara:strand:+ start:32523 stop:33089 length:567 start_codon:yes stop_codon:yes gene_type:complete